MKSKLVAAFGAFPVGLHAHRKYLAQRGVPLTIEHLSHPDVISYDAKTPPIRAISQHYPALNRAAFALRVDSDVAQLSAIRAAFGIGICQVAIAASDPNLIRVLPVKFDIGLETWVVMHEDLRSSARCRVVFDVLVQQLSQVAGST